MLVGSVTAANAAVPNTDRASLTSSGGQANGNSPDLTEGESASISVHGRYVAFTSLASNLVGGDSNGVVDIFVRDRKTGTTQRVSVSSEGEQANGASNMPSISATGRYVAFASAASNLVKRDTNGRGDVFVHDRVTGKTVRVSLRMDGGQANNYSYDPSISADGLQVAFVSAATNLVAGDTNLDQDVFVRNLADKTTERVSVSSSGEQTNVGRRSLHPSISADGRYVAFDSEANNLVDDDPTLNSFNVYVHDRVSGTTEINDPYLSHIGTEFQYIEGGGFPSISANGRYVAYHLFAADVDGVRGTHVYLDDLATHTTVRVSQSANGERGNGGSAAATVSDDGRYVAFPSDASNLITSDTNNETDIFRWDRVTGVIRRISVSTNGAEANGGSAGSGISGDGLHVAFGSYATNLVAGDTNDHADVFVRNLG
jgi:Tol biopolymer transport system component